MEEGFYRCGVAGNAFDTLIEGCPTRKYQPIRAGQGSQAIERAVHKHDLNVHLAQLFDQAQQICSAIGSSQYESAGFVHRGNENFAQQGANAGWTQVAEFSAGSMQAAIGGGDDHSRLAKVTRLGQPGYKVAVFSIVANTGQRDVVTSAPCQVKNLQRGGGFSRVLGAASKTNGLHGSTRYTAAASPAGVQAIFRIAEVAFVNGSDEITAPGNGCQGLTDVMVQLFLELLR